MDHILPSIRFKKEQFDWRGNAEVVSIDGTSNLSGSRWNTQKRSRFTWAACAIKLVAGTTKDVVELIVSANFEQRFQRRMENPE